LSSRNHFSTRAHSGAIFSEVIQMNMSKLVAVLIAACMASVSHAAVSCIAVPISVGTNSSGELFVTTTSSQIHALCSTVTQGSYTMSVQSCKNTMALLISARLSGKQAKLYYNGALSNCAAIPQWSVQPLFYFAELL
jgi:hypothetical protein